MKFLCKIIGHSKKAFGHTVVRGTFNCKRCGKRITLK